MGTQNLSAEGLFEAAFQQAVASGRQCPRESTYRFAGRLVRAFIVGPKLSATIDAALAHLCEPPEACGRAELSVRLWDCSQCQASPPHIPMPLGTWWNVEGGRLAAFRHGRVLVFERGDSKLLLDRKKGQLIGCWQDARRMPLHEQTKPFSPLLATWYHDRQVQQIHAGLVSRGAAGVLFAGGSGSGKTTCVVACALAAFDPLGDDHVGFEWAPDGGALGHSFYNGVRLDDGNLARFPELARYAAPATQTVDDKCLVMLSQVTGRTPRRAMIQSIVLPRIVGEGPTMLESTSAADVLKHLAPSSLLIPLGAGADGFHRLALLAARVPCYRLRIGASAREIPACMDQLLRDLPQAA